MTPKLPLSADRVLQQRCRTALAHHRALAAKDFAKLNYGLAELVELARRSETCAYCTCPLSYGFHFDHIVPVARTAKAHCLSNLCCCCPSCNALKGQMDAKEFRQLLAFLAGLDPRSAADLRRRILAGCRVYEGRPRRAEHR
jgi:hypothetical protein